MKSGWVMKPLQELCNNVKQDIVDGPFGSELQRKDYLPAGIPVLKIQNIKPFSIEVKNMDYISPSKFQDLKRHSYTAGDIVMTKLGAPLGVSAIVDGVNDGVIVADLVRIRAQRINTKYLCYHLNSQATNDFINSMQKGTTRPRVTLSVVRELPIAFPSPEEQQRIVSFLDEAFEGIATAKANAEKNLQNARALFDSHLQSVFTKRGEGWVEKSLEELGTITSSKRIYKSEYVTSGVPFYRTKEIKELANGRDITTELFISEARYKEIKASFGVPKQGDILLTAIGTIGEIYVVEGDYDFYFKDGNVLWLKEFSDINPHFLKYVLTAFVESLNSMAHGSAYSALPIQRLNAHSIFVPTPMEQEAIVEQLDGLCDETKRLESIYQQKLAALDALKKSLLDQAFTGQL